MRIAIEWASSEEDLREAQRLRHRVFATEMGAHLAPPAGTPPGVDADRFDPFCDHLLVRAHGPALPPRGEIVGTYRVLPPAQASAAGGYYMDTEFDLAAIAALRATAVEFGRSCVHPDWRSGRVILAMWSALAGYMRRRGLQTMIGSASIGLADGGQAARETWRALRGKHLADPRWQVHARVPLPDLDEAPTFSASRRRTPMPPLIRGYLRCGAKVLGAPALDTAFHTADLPMMMRMDEMAGRYRRHLLREPVGMHAESFAPQGSAAEDYKLDGM